MYRNEVEKLTNLTRKAIEYYEQKGLIDPQKDLNGYRRYTDDDVDKLKRIQMYRSLGLSIDEILKIMHDNSKIGSILRKKQFEAEMQDKKLVLLQRLINGDDITSIADELNAVEREESIYSRLEKAFPGYYGQCFFSAYKQYLSEPISKDGQEAYDEFIEFFDKLPTLELTQDEEIFIEKISSKIDNEDLQEMNSKRLDAIEDIEKWYSENKEAIEQYKSYKNSEEFLSSPLSTIEQKLKKYMSDNKYYEIAIPLIRKFSKSYDEYYTKLLSADKLYRQIDN